jgi:hypothetical protein
MIRPATPADEPFILSGWSSSYRMSHDNTIPMPLWAALEHQVVRWYLAKPTATTLVHGGDVLQTSCTASSASSRDTCTTSTSLDRTAAAASRAS